MVTKARLRSSSFLAWFAISVLTMPLAITNDSIDITVNKVILFLCMAIIIYCQVIVYRETRRHEKQMATQPVSEEDKQKFLKEKKAFKITTNVLLTLLVTYSPIFVVQILLNNYIIQSKNVAFITFFVATLLVILNSFRINPIIYCVRIRQFRVAFIEVVFRKSNAQAEDFEMRVFGSTNNNDNNDNDNSNNNNNTNGANNNNNRDNKNNSANNNDTNSNNNNNRDNTTNNDTSLINNDSENNNNSEENNNENNNNYANNHTEQLRQE